MKTWLITGATRGIGREIARAALASGDQVVATGRTVDPIYATLDNPSDRLLAAELDVTDQRSIDAAVDAAVARFGAIDVLVNNAGYGQLGMFEQVSAKAVPRQFAVNVFGTFEVTRKVLPIMRARRSGRIITISSMAGFAGLPGASVYCASKFAIAGWSEALGHELKSFGIYATVVHPGYFRTDFLDQSSLLVGDIEIEDYAQQSQIDAQRRDAANHSQRGNPALLGEAIVTLANAERPPVRFAAGSDALDYLNKQIRMLQENADEWSDLSCSTDFTTNG